MKINFNSIFGVVALHVLFLLYTGCLNATDLQYSGTLKLILGGDLKKNPNNVTNEIIEMLQTRLPDGIKLKHESMISNADKVIGIVLFDINAGKKTKTTRVNINPVQILETTWQVGTIYHVKLETWFYVDAFSNWYRFFSFENKDLETNLFLKQIWNNIPNFTFVNPRLFSRLFASIGYSINISDDRFIYSQIDPNDKFEFFKRQTFALNIQIVNANNISKLGFGINTGVDFKFSSAKDFKWAKVDTVYVEEGYLFDYYIKKTDISINSRSFELGLFLGPSYTFSLNNNPINNLPVSIGFSVNPGVENFFLTNNKTDKTKDKYLFQIYLMPSLRVYSPPISVFGIRLTAGCKMKYPIFRHSGIINFENQNFYYGSNNDYHLQFDFGLASDFFIEKLK